MVSVFILSLDNSLILLAIDGGPDAVADQGAEATRSLRSGQFRAEFAWSSLHKYQFIDPEFIHSDSRRYWSAVLEFL